MLKLMAKIKETAKSVGRWIKRKAKEILIATGVVGVAMAASIALIPETNEISKEKLIEKYNLAAEIKSKYQLLGSELILPSKDRDSVEVKLGEKIITAIYSSTTSPVISTDETFKPVLTLNRWNEATLKIKPDLSAIDTKDKTLIFEGDKIRFGTPKIDYRFYEIADSTTTPEGGYEYEIILKSKPAVNAVSLSIESGGLDFYYQPELTAKEISKGNTRPENVVGSYAVYYKNQGDFSEGGGKNYKSGKAFQIYRPKITDANNNWVWGELNITGGTLTITIPQIFIDTGVYPITVDPTFGYTTAGASSASLENTIRGSLFTLSQNGTFEYIMAYINPSATAFTTKCKVYDSLHSQVTNGETNATTGFSGANWYKMAYPTYPVLTPADYVLSCWSQSRGGTNVIYYDAGSANQGHATTSTYGTWPSSPTFTHNTNKYSIYTNNPATLYEYLNTGDDDYAVSYGVNWKGQTFTPATAHTITSVKLKLIKVTGAPAGNLNVNIRATTAGLPSGANLATSSMLANDISTTATWYEFTLTPSVLLTASTLYAIIWSNPSGDVSNYTGARMIYQNAVDQYTGGDDKASADSGVTWNNGYGNYSDYMFEDWGDPVAAATELKPSSIIIE